MNGDEGSVEPYPLIIQNQGEVVFVNPENPPLWVFPVPVGTPDGDDVGFVLSVKGCLNAPGAEDGDP